MIKKSLLLICVLLTTQAWSFNQGMSRLFSVRYYKNYKYSECTENISSFLLSAKNYKVNLSKANVITILNNGDSSFGKVNALYARSSGKKNPKSLNQRVKKFAGEKNWKFHVVLENEGHILDFDFGNEPRILTTIDYFEKMFLGENTDETNKETLRKIKLQDYQLIIQSAERSLHFKDAEQDKNAKKILLKDYLSSLSNPQ